MKLFHVVFGMVVLAGMPAATFPAVQQTHPVGRTTTGLATIPPPTPDADALAEQMRALAKNPKDVDALIRAGELTLTLGDPTAAAVLFSRAEKIEPNNPRMKVGMAATLVRMERPGQALRLFAQAEKSGYDVAKFAADRGLAYDLVGAQERAQRDYRLALAHDRQDETLRRYALSLGISGKADEAMVLLDPLLRNRDRAAWRDRAFIFAMNGKPDEAEEIATAMMPGPVSEGLEPFFRRLDDLSPVDRAFAVHFGELSPSPARLADARLAPPLPALTPEPAEPASAEPKAAAPKARRGRAEARIKPGRTQIASADTATPAPAVRPAPSRSTAGIAPGPEQAPSTTASVRRAPTDAVAAAPASGSPSTSPSAVGGEDSILERIIANISVPASELANASVPANTAPATPAASGGTSDVAKAQTALAAAAAKAEADRLAAVEEAATRKAEREARAEAERKAAEKKAAEERAAAVKRAAEEKAAAKKKAEEEKKARAEPSRFWVQVAGGANEKTLGRAYARIVDKAPELMKGKQGWWTPLNATNRVLTGPFKSADAAQDFVNKLAGAGVSAFPFTSKDGQKVTKLSRR